MNGISKRIFARARESDFAGREAELDRLIRHAKGPRTHSGLVVLGEPSAGTSELLRQAYDRLFAVQEEIIPFYFELKASDGSAKNAALRFLREFLVQTVAWRRRDANIIAGSPEISEIAELAVPLNDRWIDALVVEAGDKLNDERAFVHRNLSAPLRAAADGMSVFVMIDSLHSAALIEDGERLLEDMRDIYESASFPFIFAGQRRFLFARTPFPTMHLEHLSFAGAGGLIENLAVRNEVAINDQTRDLIAVQLGGNPGHISSLFASAAARGDALDGFIRVEQAYTDEILGGRLSRNYKNTLDTIFPDAAAQATILELLGEIVSGEDGKVSSWRQRIAVSGAEFDAALKSLHCHEIVTVDAGSIKIAADNIVLRDYIEARTRLESDVERRAFIVGDTLSANITRAPQLMARFYRKRSAVGLRELLRSFDGRPVSHALIDYEKFKEQFLGAGGDKILRALREDNKKISLPNIVYAAHTVAFYPEFGQLCDAERSAVGLGFAETADKGEIVWLAAEIDAKLEATREAAEFWCDRLEMAAVSCGFSKFKLWLVAPEGFSPDAMNALRKRDAYGSSRKQAEMLAKILGSDLQTTGAAAGEYEITVPMGDQTEMIAAHVVEEIAKRHNFPAKAINQIKTALVEACINAAEHSLSPDRRIYQKFAVDGEKLTITVANRGLRLTDKTRQENQPDEARRGWGLRLIKGLMDEVDIEQTDDGTRLTMVKYLKPA